MAEPEEEVVEEAPADTEALRQALTELYPVAKALVTVAEGFVQIEEISASAQAAIAKLEAAQAEQAEAERQRDEAYALVEKAKAEMIEAQANVDKLVASARELSAKIIDEAKQQAVAEVEAIKASHTDEIALLVGQKSKLEAELRALQEAIKKDRLAHDQVLASIGSLKSRLGAA